MNPIRVMDSVVGLIGAAGKVGSVLLAVKKSLVDAPRLMDQMLSQVKELKISLSAVQSFLDGASSVPRERISLIRVEQLRATLTEAVLTFSELETLVTSIAKDNGLPITARLMYVWKEDAVTSIMLRLERHKSSLSLMLNIVQCESDLEAERSQQTLQNLVEKLLMSNQDLSLRLRSIEDKFESRSIMTACFRNGTMDELAEGESETGNEVPAEIIPTLRFSILAQNTAEDSSRNDFQVDLGTSRVYKRTDLYESDVSFTSSVARTHAWSIFSGLSLSDVSMISAIALPLYLDEISNKQWYTFSDHGNMNLQFTNQFSNRPSPVNSADTAPTASGTTLSSSIPSIFRKKIKKPRARASHFLQPKQDRELTDSTLPGRLNSNTHDPGATVRSPAVAKSNILPQSSSQTDLKSNGMTLYKLVILGDSDVGKTGLTVQLFLPHFVENYDPTIEDSHRKQMVIDDQVCMLEVLNTTGPEEYTALRDQWIRDAEGFLVVYSISSRASFTLCQKFFYQIEEAKASLLPRSLGDVPTDPPFYPVVLVGNNSDRVTKREVSTQEGHALAKELGCDFVEASSKNCINVEKAFYDVVRALRKHRLQTSKQPMTPKRFSSSGKPGEMPVWYRADSLQALLRRARVGESYE